MSVQRYNNIIRAVTYMNDGGKRSERGWGTNINIKNPPKTRKSPAIDWKRIAIRKKWRLSEILSVKLEASLESCRDCHGKQCEMLRYGAAILKIGERQLRWSFLMSGLLIAELPGTAFHYL